MLLEKDKVKSLLFNSEGVLESITAENGTVYNRNVDGDYYDKDCNQFKEASLIFESKVSEDFKSKVLEISYRLNVDANHLMAVMAFETGESFSTTIRNGAGANTFGLIQFMNVTLKDINNTFGTKMTLSKLVKLSETDQLEYVYYQYSMWQKRKGKFNTVSDFYMAVFSPKFAGKPDSHIMYRKKTVKEKRVKRDQAGKPVLDKKTGKEVIEEIEVVVKNAYSQNSGLDSNKDGKITKGEAGVKVKAKLERGTSFYNK